MINSVRAQSYQKWVYSIPLFPLNLEEGTAQAFFLCSLPVTKGGWSSVVNIGLGTDAGYINAPASSRVLVLGFSVLISC